MSVRACIMLFVCMLSSLYSSFVDSVMIFNIMHGIVFCCDFVVVGAWAYARHPSGAYVLIGLWYMGQYVTGIMLFCVVVV